VLQPNFQLVRIKWIDIEANTGWSSLEVSKAYKLKVFDAAGFLIEWNDEFILLAGIKSEEQGQINADVYYPVGCVLSVEEV